MVLVFCDVDVIDHVVLCIPLFFFFLFFVFFFQAEDGIRDLVRSRGLGDVYKRQLIDEENKYDDWELFIDTLKNVSNQERNFLLDLFTAVSYTHLTLPTSDLV